MHGTAIGPLAVVCLLNASTVAAQVIINEFLPDPDGADAGREFVELLNTASEPADLSGLKLEFANGAEGPQWQVRWTGSLGPQLAPGARFLIVDRGWAGAARADAEVSLALQNGPDAIRLVGDGVVLDLVGYGALSDTLLMEGRPVIVAVGRSLARRPDGRDTDDNRADFVAAAPSPGAPNFATRALVALESSVEPPSLSAPGGPVAVAALLRNDGVEDLPTARLRLACGPDTVGAMLDAVPSGQERRVEWLLRPAAAGRWPLQARLELPALPETIVVRLGHLQIGAAELRVSEVLGAPRSGQGEWIELEAVGDPLPTPGAYRLRDEDGGWVALPALDLAAGRRLIVAQDSLALAGWLAANAAGPPDASGCGATIVPAAPWPSLNNAPPDGRTRADRVLLADSLGTILDHADLGEDGRALTGDRSLERVAPGPGASSVAPWAESLAAAGSTPGCPNSVDPPAGAGATGADGLAVDPPLVSRPGGQATVHLRFEVPTGAGGWDLGVFDLDGRPVRDLGGDGLGPGPRALFWDLRDDQARPVAAGGYIVALRWRGGGRGQATPVRRLVVVR
ncbi:MAG: lamin tail domain-containing protein [bacterium]|nr:lamin tail domain-containing protein [bacterium]